MALTFITGPVRSGKTRFAERLASATGFAVTCVTTHVPEDENPLWRERADMLAARRPATWRLIETARSGAPSLEALLSLAGEREALIVDTVAAYLAQDVARAEALAGALSATRAHAIVIGEEVGWSVAPPDPAGRALREVAGALQAQLALQAEHAYLVVSGFALDLRAQGRPIDR